MTSAKHKRVIGLVAAFVGTTLAFGGAAAPAFAAPLIEPSDEGTLSIHKLETPEAGGTTLPSNGLQVDTSALTPIEGVTYELSRVNGIDLSANLGWKQAEDLSALFDSGNAAGSISAAGYGLSLVGTDITDDTGLAYFDNLEPGLYLVNETARPAGVNPAEPFLVTVPITHPTDKDSWVFDVHVYPKSSVTTGTKTVDDADVTKIGDIIDWTIKGDIPNEAEIDGYKITDQLDSKLDYIATTVSLEDGTVLPAGSATINYDSVTRLLTVQFTAAGLDFLEKHADTRVVVEVRTEVKEIGEIANTATIYPNLPSFTIKPGEPGGPTVTPPSYTKFGDFTMQKVDSKGKALPGAKFKLYTSNDDAKAGKNEVELDGATEFEVDSNGVLTFTGLRYSGWANGKEVTKDENGYALYFLVESVAPEGYALLADPVTFTVDADTTKAGVDVKIENVRNNGGFTLPATGGEGIALYIGAGALALLVAGGLMIRARRRSSVETVESA